MPDLPVVAARTKPKRHYKKHERKHIALEDGDVLIPRAQMAAEIGITERTLVKLDGVSVTKIANVCYVRRNATLAAYMERHTSHPPELTTAKRIPQQHLPKLTASEQRKLIALIESQPVQGQRGRPRPRRKAPDAR